MAKRKELTCLLFHETPDGTHYREGCYSWVQDSTAEKYIGDGYATEWNPQEQESEQYPKHTGGSWYELSNGEKVQGKDNAIESENNL